MIAIDFEYRAHAHTYELICCAAKHDDEPTQKFWLADKGLHQNKQELLSYIDEHKDDIFVAHALSLAEARCFFELGIDPCDFKWVDTFNLAKILDANLLAKKPKKKVTTSDGEEIEISDNKESLFSLAHLCKNRLFIDIDTDHKEEMRKHCIDGTYAEHAQEILDYCASDVEHLIPLANDLLKEYDEAFKHSKLVGGAIDDGPTDGLSAALEIGHVCCCCAEIARRGFPLNAERVRFMQEKAAELLLKVKQDFNEKYNGSFEYEGPKCDPQRKFVAKPDALRDLYMMPEMEKRHIEWSELSETTGKPSMNSKYIKSLEGVAPVFKDYVQMKKIAQALQSIANPDRSWLRNFDYEDSLIDYQDLRPYTSNTFRCQPAPSKGFIPGWAKPLYALLDPPEGYVLVEFDYTSEETAIQAAITNDNAYRDAYASSDLYLWTGWVIGLIPQDEYLNMEPDKLKGKYKENGVRQKCKSFWLGYSYGAGAETLAAQCGISVGEAKKFKDKMDKKFRNASKYKEKFILNTQCSLSSRTHWRFGDGVLVRTKPKKGELEGKPTVIGNWPFQGTGAVILRQIIKWAHAKKVPVIATVHDAIWCMFKDDDKLELNLRAVQTRMKQIADRVLGEDIMRVGEPDIIHHGDFWAPETHHLEVFDKITKGFFPDVRKIIEEKKKK